MGVKINQLKKFSVKALKEIVKKNKLGKISKKKKAQLIGLISNCPECKDILSKLSLPLKKAKKPASAKQLAARERFKVMVKAKKDKKKQPNPVDNLENKGISELMDMAMDKGLKVEDNITKEQLLNAVRNGKKNLKELEQKDLEVRQTKPVAPEIVKKAKKEIKQVMDKLIEVEVEKIDSKKKISKIGKKAFLDGVFGVNKFNIRKEIKNIINEAEDSQLEIFLSFSKLKKKEILKKRFDSSKSLGQLLKSFIK